MTKVFTDEFSKAYDELRAMVESLEPVKIEEGSQGLKGRKDLLQRLIWAAFNPTEYRTSEIEGDGDRVNITITFLGEHPNLSFWVQFKGGKANGD